MIDEATKSRREAPCEYCGEPVGLEGEGTGCCDRCFYGMRLDPEWEAEMRALGREVHYRGGCVVSGNAIFCRNPYAPGAGGEEGEHE